MAEILFYDTTGALWTGTALSNVPGSPGTAVQIEAWNNRGEAGAEDVTNARLIVMAEVSTIEGQVSVVESGVEALDAHYLEARVVSGLNGLTVPTGPWRRLGARRWLALPTLPNDRGVLLELRSVTPISSTTFSTTVLFRAIDDPAVLIEGLSESSPNGIVSGLGRRSLEAHARGSVPVQNPAGVDDQVQVPYQAWDLAGSGYAHEPALVQLDANDGDSAALAAGEGYYAAVSLGPQDGVQVTKGSKAATPLSVDDEPALPADHLQGSYYLVLREFDGLIEDADIEDRSVLGYFAASASPASPDITVGPGVARAENGLAVLVNQSVVTAPLSSSGILYLGGDGALQVIETGSAPVGDPVALWGWTTDATGITALVDLRVWVGPIKGLVHLKPTRSSGLQVGDDDTEIWTGQDAYLVAVSPVLLAASGDAAALSAGALSVDVLVTPPGGAEASIFAAGAEPAVQWDAPLANVTADPITRLIPAGSRIRSAVTTIPTATTVQSTALVYLHLEVPR